MVSTTSPIPTWIYRWLKFTTFISLMDGSFCVLRPHSLPGGCLEPLYYGYKYYIAIDKNYANPKDVFVWTQGFGNLVEVSINLLILFGFFKTIQRTKMATILVSLMTGYKTCLFVTYSLEIPTGHVVESWLGEFLVLGSAVVWIIVPGLVINELTKHFIGGDVAKSSNVTKSRNVDESDKEEEEEEEEEDETDSTKRRYNLRKR